MVSLADYDAWKAKQQQAGVGAASVVLGQDFKAEPDAVAADLSLAKDFGSATGKPVPPAPLVTQFRPAFQTAVDQARAGAILSKSPTLTEWLREPDNAAVARDDLDGLSWWETAAGAAGNAVVRGAMRLPLSFNQFEAETMARQSEDAGRSFGEILSDQTATRRADGSVVFQKPIPGPDDLYWSAARFLTSRLSDLFGSDDEAKAEFHQQRVGQIASEIAAIPMSPGADAFRKSLATPTAPSMGWGVAPETDVMSQLGDFLTKVAADPGGFSAFIAETAVESAPSLAASAAVTFATRSPAAGAVFMGGVSGVQERLMTPSDFFSGRGIDISTPEGAARVISDPALMAEAARAGEIRGVIIGALDGLSGSLAGQTLAKTALGDLALNSIVQATLGGGGEGLAQVASGQKFNLNDVLVEALAEFVTSPFEAAGVGGKAFIDTQAKAKSAEARVTLFKELSGQATSSKLRERMPDKFRQFVERAMANGPIANVFVPAEKFVEYFQGQGIDPNEIAASLEGVGADDLQTALETGGDLKIPTSSYAASIAGSNHDAWLMENMKFSPDDFTSAEAKEFNARAQDAMEEAYQLADQLRRDADELRSVETEIYDTMVERLRVAGRATDVATSEAMLYPAFYRTMAERSGISTAEFLERYPLPKVEGAMPAGMQLRDVTELKRTLAEARARRKLGGATGLSLLEFLDSKGGVDDPGGDIAAMDAATIKRGKGKKTLRIVRKPNLLSGMTSMFGGSAAANGGNGIDQMARAAVEAGYMAHDPRVMAYQEAMRTGGETVDLIPALLDAIRGEQAGAIDRASPDGDVAPDGVDTMEEFLAGLEVSLDNTDDEIRAAMERSAPKAGDGEPGLLFAQPSLIDELTAWRGKLRDFLTGKLPTGSDLRVSRTPAVLRALGVPTKQVVFRAGKVRKVMTDHPDIGNSSLLDLPAMLADPMVVYEEVGKESDFIVVTSKRSANGSPVVVAVKSEGETNGQAASIVLTIYPLDGGNAKIAEVARAGRIRYVRDEKAAAEYELTGANSRKGLPKQSPGQRPTQKVLSAADVFKGQSFEQQPDAQGFGGGGAPRGSIRFPSAGVGRGATIMSTFAGADLSTVIHESGHYFLTVFQDMARTDPAGPFAADYSAIKDWWHSNADAVAKDAMAVVPGVTVTADDVRLALDAGTSGDAARDAAINVGMQEQFARATEAYLMEGKAPSIELRSAFEKFRAWLISIYKHALGLNVAISDEMRAVFDRMLATDDEIAAAKADAGATEPIFPTAEQMGRTPEDYAKFRKLYGQANDEAAAKVLAAVMEPIRRAATAAYKAERKAVQADVTGALQNEPVYRAIQELRFGKGYDGAEVPAVKLSRAAIEKDYGVGHLGFLPGATEDGKGHRNAVFSDEGGVHPDVVAEMYGFTSGEAFLDALEKAPALADAIAAEVEKEMKSRHNDPLTDGSIQATALDATHSDKRGAVLAAELQALSEIAGYDRGLTAKEARETARRTLRTMKVRDAVRSDRFLTAERNAGEAAFKLAATVTREGMWMDAARRRVANAVSGALRGNDGALALGVNAATDKANANTMRNNKRVGELIEAKRRQLLNHMLYAESLKVAAGVEALVDKVGKLNRPDAKLGKVRNIDYVKAARAVAAKFGLAKPDRDFDFAVWMEQLRIDDPLVADALGAAIATYSQDAKPFKDLSVAELGAIGDAIESLLEVGKRARLLEINGQTVDRELAISELRDVLDGRTQTENAALKAKLNGAQKFKVKALSVLSALRRMETWSRDMDDGKAGAFTKYLVKPIMDAVGVYRMDKAARLTALLAIIEPNKADLLGAAISAPELGYTFENKGEFLHALLHTGNESNLEKLLLGRGWSPGLTGQTQRVTAGGKMSVDKAGNPLMTRGRVDTSKWDALVARMIAEGKLTKADYQMAQEIWDLMDAIKRPAQSAHRRVFGYYFQEVEASPVVTPFGTFRGGYVPAIADGDASNDGQIRADQAALEAQQTSFMFPTTGGGFTKSRVQNYTTPLSLNLMLLPAHMDKVLRFTHLNPVVRQTASLVNSRELRGAIDAVDKTIIPNLITPWLQRTAQQAVEAQPTTPAGRVASSFFRAMRKRVGIHTMFLNLVNTAQQVTGLSSAMILVKPSRMKTALLRFSTGGGADMRAEAVDASAFMRDRIENAGREITGRIQEAIVKPTAMSGIDGFVSKHGYVLQQTAQNLVDVITWHAAYDQSVAGGMTPDEAVFEADSVIRRTMGDFSPENLSMFETGSAFMRVFTMFYSYFNGQANLVGGEMQTAMRAMGWNGAGRMFFIYLFGMAIPAIVGEMIVKAASGGFEDDEEDGYVDEVAEVFFGSQMRYAAAMLPVVGQLGMSILNRFNSQFYDDRLSTSPVLSVVERAAGAPAAVLDAATGNGSSKKAVVSMLAAIALITGIPLGQVAKMAGYGVGVLEGSSTPANPIDVLEGLASGRDGSEN